MWLNLRQYLTTGRRSTEKLYQNPTDSWCPYWDASREPPEQKPEALPLAPICSIKFFAWNTRTWQRMWTIAPLSGVSSVSICACNMENDCCINMAQVQNGCALTWHRPRYRTGVCTLTWHRYITGACALTWHRHKYSTGVYALTWHMLRYRSMCINMTRTRTEQKQVH
jgi:hypothetical protein